MTFFSGLIVGIVLGLLVAAICVAQKIGGDHDENI